MINFMKKWNKIKRSEILDLVNLYGPLPGKPFPGRSAILIKMLQLSSKEIRAIYEKSGSKKIGHVVPGSDIQILDEEQLFSEDKNVPFINFAWHIPEEIKKYMLQNGYSGEMVNIIDINV